MQSLKKIIEFIDYNPLSVLGTINGDGTPHGAVVYTCADEDCVVYFITKVGTLKYKNLSDHPIVSLTTVSKHKNSTLQAQGRAGVVKDPKIIDWVFKQIVRANTTSSEWLPPIAKIRAGAYVLIGVRLSFVRLAEFQGRKIGDEHIFTQLP